MKMPQHPFSHGPWRPAPPIRRRLGLFAIPLGVPGLALIGSLTCWAGPAGTNAAPHPTVEQTKCPEPGLAGVSEWAGLHHDEPNLRGIDPGEEPVRLDCGTGEVWRRHVP